MSGKSLFYALNGFKPLTSLLLNKEERIIVTEGTLEINWKWFLK